MNLHKPTMQYENNNESDTFLSDFIQTLEHNIHLNLTRGLFLHVNQVINLY